MNKAAIYLRVSTNEQNTDNQRPFLEKMASSRGLELWDEYEEEETAWKAGHQKELTRLLHDAHQRKFDTVLVWALDRLTRGGALAILSLVNHLHLYGVRVLSYQESWTEVPGDMQELLFAIVGWVAKMESQRRSERVKAALGRPGTRERVGKRGPDHKQRKPRLQLGIRGKQK